MKVVHVSIGAPPPPFTTRGGGVQRRVAELAREQVRRGDEVTVLCPGEQSGCAEIDGVHVRYLRCRSPQPWAHQEFQLRSAACLVRRRYRPDVLHVHNEPEAGLAARPTGVPTLLSYDNFYFRGGRQSHLGWLYRRSLAAFDLLLAPSEYCRDASTVYWDLPPERVHVLPNGVNLAQFSPDPDAAARERAAFHGPVVLYLGRVCRQKGVDTLLVAAQRLEALGVRAHVVLAGPIGQFDDRPRLREKAEWEHLIRSAGARDLGRVPDSRLAGLLTMADVFVMPTAELEMQGMAALEAEACGTPVVASDHGGLRETVPERCGLRFPPGNADELARALAYLLTDASARRTYAEAALEHARTLSWARVVERLTPLYEAAQGSHA